MIRPILEEIGHPQPPTPVQTDNSMAVGIANGTIGKKIQGHGWTCVSTGSKTESNNKDSFWSSTRTKGILNRGDYSTKHHPTSRHIKMRPTYLHHVAANACTTGTARVCSPCRRHLACSQRALFRASRRQIPQSTTARQTAHLKIFSSADARMIC